MKIRNWNKSFGCLALCACLLLPACKTRRESAASLAGLNEEGIFRAMVDNALKFETLSGKLNMEIGSGNKRMSSGASLKIIKNRAVQLSVQPLFGIEAFRMTVSEDSLLIVDRLNRQYALESTRDMQGNARPDFNFHNLQAIFTNSIFLAGKTHIDPADYRRFSVEKTSRIALIQTTDRQGVQYLFSGDYHGQIQSLYIAPEKDSRMSLLSDYSDFRAISASRLFPMQMRMTVKTAPGSEMQLNIVYSGIKLDTPLELNFDIPAKYRRIRLADALNLLKKLQ
jgi:hypothetical protein